MNIIGLGSRAQVGKDTLADNLFYSKVAFADGVRELALKANPIIGGGMPLSDFVNVQGWETAKQTAEVRTFLQNLGQGARLVVGEDVWLKIVTAKVKELQKDKAVKGIAVTDVRYPNEFKAIKKLGGIMIRIDRESAPKLSHPSEDSLDDADWDAVVENNFTIPYLVDRVRAIIDERNCS